MLCDKCKKNTARMFYTQNVNGHETKMALCGECMDEMKKTAGFGDSFFGMDPFNTDIGTLVGSLFTPQKTRTASQNSKKCDLCGMNFADLMKEGKAGCPRCYDTFGDELERTIASIHGGSRHTGSMPSAMREAAAEADRIKELRRQISEAVACEDYETAASLRDMIKEIENGREDRV